MSRRIAVVALVILALGATSRSARAEWSSMGSISGPVFALTVFRGELVAAGNFDLADGREAHNVARWDGSSWQPLGTGLGYANPLLDQSGAWATSLLVKNDELYVGGEFTRAGNATVGYVARWDGNTWFDVDGGVGGQVFALASYQGSLMVGGRFERTSQHGQIYYVSSHRNGGWRAVGEGLSSVVYTLRPFQNRLLAGGRFSSTGTGRSLNRVAEWDGNVWVSVGDDITADRTRVPLLPATVLDIAEIDGQLYATGVIDEIGTEPFYGLALWANNRWIQIPVAAGATPLHLDRGFTLGSFGGELVVGGVVTQGVAPAGRHLTRYRAGRWEPLGTGVNDFVQAMIEFDGALIVGGNFISAGGKRANHIARWTETGTAVWAPQVRVDDRGNAVDLIVETTAAQQGQLSLRREGPRGSALVDRRTLDGGRSVVLRDPSPLGEESRYFIQWESLDGEVQIAGPFDVQATSRPWSMALRQLPTDSDARFQWSSPRAGRVVIEIFDLRGRKLQTLFDGEVAAGPTVFDWDGRDRQGRSVARGRYVLRARQDSNWRSLLTTHRP